MCLDCIIFIGTSNSAYAYEDIKWNRGKVQYEQMFGVANSVRSSTA